MYVARCIFPRLELFFHAWNYFPTLDNNEILIQDKHHVCSKMYGGGMGDQIKRYCELLSPEVYLSIYIHIHL